MSLSNFSNSKRQKILEIATEIFLEKGYSGTSTSELLRRVGGSKTTIYAHFGDKAGLFLAVVDEVLQDVITFPVMLEISELSTRDALTAIADQYLKTVLSSRYISLVRIVIAEVSRFPEIGKAFYEHGPGKSYTDFQTFLDQKVSSNDLSISDTKRATDLFFGTLLHREFLARLYGLKDGPLRSRKVVAAEVADEFLRRYT